jgi:hypothetical protein
MHVELVLDLNRSDGFHDRRCDAPATYRAKMRGLPRQDAAFGRLAYDCSICGRKHIQVSNLQLRAAGSLEGSGTAIECSVFTVSPARCAMRFTIKRRL